MSKKLQLSIPKPCHENWDAMSPVEQGKFCGSCQKQVVDFSNMSDRQVAEFFKKPSTGSVCGRFMSDQLDRDIEIPKKRIPWVKYFFSIALPAFFISKAAAQNPAKIGKVMRPSEKDTIRVPITSEIRTLGMVLPTTIKAEVKDTIPQLTGTVAVANQLGEKGTVIDGQTGKPLVGASILMVSTIGKENYVSDRNGSFVLEIYRKITVHHIEISAPGYEKKELTLSAFLKTSKHNVVLQPIQFLKGEIEAKPVQSPVMGGLSIQVVKNDTVIKQPDCVRPVMGKIAMPVQATKAEIQGIVVDENGEPVAFASVVTGKPGEGIMADENGLFTIKKEWLASGKAITVSSVNHDNKKIAAGEEKYENGKLVVQLQARKMLDEVVVASFYVVTKCTLVVGQISIEQGETIKSVEKKDSIKNEKIIQHLDESKLAVYPNPVSSGSQINLSFQKLSEGYYLLQILNQSGQSVQQNEVWIDEEARLLSVDVPNVAAGSYFLILTNKKTGKKYTEKIIIQ